MIFAVVTENKSGTHLCSALLRLLGLEGSYIHMVGPTTYIHYDKNNLHAARGFGFKEFLRGARTTDEILNLIPNNTFFTSHMTPIQAGNTFKDFKKIVLTRDKEERLASLERWRRETGRKAGLRGDGSEWLKRYNNCFHLEFNDMIYKNVTKIDELQKFIFGEVRVNSEVALDGALNTRTITKSGIRPGDNWTNE